MKTARTSRRPVSISWGGGQEDGGSAARSNPVGTSPSLSFQEDSVERSMQYAYTAGEIMIVSDPVGPIRLLKLGLIRLLKR